MKAKISHPNTARLKNAISSLPIYINGLMILFEKSDSPLILIILLLVVPFVVLWVIGKVVWFVIKFFVKWFIVSWLALGEQLGVE